MAFPLVADVIECAGIGGNAKLLLIVIANFTNAGTGLAWPSVDTLGMKTGLSRATVIRLIGQLERDGLLTIERGGGRLHSSRYQLTIPRSDPCVAINKDGDGGTLVEPSKNTRQKIRVAL